MKNIQPRAAELTSRMNLPSLYFSDVTKALS
jgi:hypothetical protein